MNAPVIQVKYDELETVISRLRNQIAQTQALKTALRSSYQPLQQGGWLGEGSQAFIREMDQIVFPAVNRLENALQQAEGVTREIMAIMRAAEEEASRPFRGGPTADGGGAAHSALHDAGELLFSQNGDDGGSSNHSAGKDGASLGVKENDTDASKEVKPARDPRSLFTDEYMTNMIGRTWQGEGTRALAEAMDDLTNPNASPAQVSSALDRIAQIRGIDRADLDRQYETFKELRAKTNNVAQLDQKQHPGYMGSRDQLRFGQIVGDAFDIDPVFGALLNPTGGIVGSNNAGFAFDGSALGYHAAFHDAGGFLYTQFGIGPGYNYLEQENRPINDAFTGQESGIRYWNEKIDNGILLKTLTNIFGTGAGLAVDYHLSGPIVQGVETVASVANTTLEVAEATYNTTKYAVERGYNAAQNAVREFDNNLRNMRDAAFSWIPGIG
jgi:WXG100 family type VII secretion target